MSFEFLDDECSEESFLCELSREWLGDPDVDVDPAVMMSNETPEVVVRLSQNCCAMMGASAFTVAIRGGIIDGETKRGDGAPGPSWPRGRVRGD